MIRLIFILITLLTTTAFAQLKITHPIGGERIQAGIETKITWKEAPNTSDYQIYFSYDNGQYWDFITDSATGGSYDWSVPNINKDSCLIRIENKILNQEWSVTQDTLKNYNTQHLINSKDGGFIIVENTWIIGSAPDKELKTDIKVIKTDKNGTMVWSKVFGGLNGEEIANAAIETKDGNIIIIGRTNSTDFGLELKGSNDLLLLNLNSKGEMIWKKNYGGTKSDIGKDIVELDDGSFILGGDTFSNDGDVSKITGNSDYWLIKIDSKGEVIWERTYGRELYETLNKIRVYKNNEIVLLGSSNSRDSVVINARNGFFTDKEHLWLVKVDSLGNLIWDYQYERAIDNASDFVFLNNGSILTVGYSVKPTDFSSIRYHWVLTVDKNGDFIEVKDLNPSPEEYVKEMMISKNGSIYYISNLVNYYRITYLLPNSEIMWFKDYYNMKGINSFVETNDGSLVIVGVREKIRDFFEVMLIKLSIAKQILVSHSDIFSILYNTTNVIKTNNNPNIIIHPSIVSNTANVTIDLTESGATTLELFDSQGRIMETLLSGYQIIGLREMMIDVSQYASGRYYLKLVTPNSNKTEILEVQR